MLPRGKIDLNELKQLVKEGKSGREIAEYFGVSRPAVSQAIERLKKGAVKHNTKIITLEHGGEVVKRNLAVMEQLTKANEELNSLLDLLSRWSKGDKKALEQLQARQGIKSDDPRALLIKTCREIQNGTLAYLEILKTVFSFSEVENFMNEILNCIGEESAELQSKIIKRLEERRLSRGIFNTAQTEVKAS